MSDSRLFVYGSLKRGFRHHRELVGARFEAEVMTAKAYSLMRAGQYPVLVEAGTHAIQGELYLVSNALLVVLDIFEGSAYERKLIDLADGSRAQAYVARTPADPRWIVIKSGVWLEHEPP